eukprot:TRINITY_DN1017_c0_g1_i1.p1 TRINITY_DN1017_c0_g1~~TRINITY_DN1017_c0_g1_i1.p1  ORF type:complete len:463 (+),score=166.97 TRINITY_DN1017_c0_g1_i1:196-1584(+)
MPMTTPIVTGARPELSELCAWARKDGSARVDAVAEKFAAAPVRVKRPGQMSDTEFAEIVHQRTAELADTDAEGDSFYVVDIGTVEHQMREWCRLLPRVRPFYAWKCNGNQALVETLAALGAGFDCASRAEFEQAIRIGGIDPERDIIFANPCKQASHCRAARKAGIRMVTYDNEYELPKIKQQWPEAQVLLRIATDDSKSICELSSKYGAALERCPGLIAQALDLGLNLVGVSFHVGSGCCDATAFVTAAQDARKVFDMAESQGVKMTVLDIGGGFPGDAETTPTFQDIAEVLRPCLDSLFPDTQLIAEPGRYFACASHSLATNVFSKREIDIRRPPSGDSDVSSSDDRDYEDEDETELQYYVNEGLYQSFNCVFYDHAIVTPKPLSMGGKVGGPQRLTTIFGPTCDGLDCIAKRIPFPELDIGDWIYFRDFGAYTTAGASSFNGFELPNMCYVRSHSAPSC